MSARETLIAALRDALTNALSDVTVFDAPPVRAALPHAVIEEPIIADWSTKDVAGREGRVAVHLHDAGERPTRLRALIDLADAAVETIAPVQPGWRIVTLNLVRSRIVRSGTGWVATSEFRVRMLATI